MRPRARIFISGYETPANGATEESTERQRSVSASLLGGRIRFWFWFSAGFRRFFGAYSRLPTRSVLALTGASSSREPKRTVSGFSSVCLSFPFSLAPWEEEEEETATQSENQCHRQRTMCRDFLAEPLLTDRLPPLTSDASCSRMEIHRRSHRQGSVFG